MLKYTIFGAALATSIAGATKAQNVVTLEEYEICGAVAIAVAVTLDQKTELEGISVYLDVSAEQEYDFQRYIKAFIEDMPPIIAQSNGITRSDLVHSTDKAMAYLMRELDEALRSVRRYGPDDYIEVFSRHGRILSECASKAGLE
jgi:hypothetical protein